jgi:hypothetical protein
VAGRLLLSLSGDVLRASNTGAPLDAAGVEALSTLRASAKRDDAGSVGRFGVGFAAVVSVCDEPVVASGAGSVQFSRRRTAEAVAARPPLAAELARRAGAVPVLRLPWPAQDEPAAAYDTTVVVPLRDAAAVETVTRLLGSVDAVLLLALPGLAKVVVDGVGPRRVLTAARDGSSVW